ncbi:hypothetical protein [Flammeovirga kamogawensis]|uniref:DUF4412 domain-containing protein n=1 Tax=Flammeovirga kamogawensis TaxID=373891 RepID=A0ABX8GUJ5_9BACT|nr:hypothetical protein [Flammeovirga kamogawensis]MBB6459879.1 hypothetical protein [Flammeovirga kamogawensis]QWG07068.1 hypothetical protein KM029_17465 [Flammeovirga kamogawensis]TRX68889.1 hypothetical protein EO216_12455 [Flammeovirga kamogawensis]
MKLIQILSILLITACSAFAQGSYPFEKQIVFQQSQNGNVQEYPKATLLVGPAEYLGARVVSEEDAGSQYMLCDFENNKYLILMRQFGQKIAIESPVDPKTLDVLGIKDVPVKENKKSKEEILGAKCRAFVGEKDGQKVEVFIGKVDFPAKGLENLTKLLTEKIGIDLNDGEVLLGVRFTDPKNNSNMMIKAVEVVNKKYNLSTVGYNKMSTSGFGF